MIIGLTGFARSGKDSVANVLVDNYGFTRIAFADPIRDMLFEIDPILENGTRLSSMVKEYGWDIAKANPEVRRLLQALGVSARNNISNYVWISTATRKIVDINSNYVITDVRFNNEANVIRSIEGTLWRVERPGVGPVNSHVSESEMSTFEVDQTFINDGTVEDLEAAVKARMVGLLV